MGGVFVKAGGTGGSQICKIGGNYPKSVKTGGYSLEVLQILQISGDYLQPLQIWLPPVPPVPPAFTHTPLGYL